MFTFLLVVHALIAASLVAVILMQRSEGGGLTSSGSPSGLMSARGAADFMTRATTILASLFVLMSIALAALATVQRAPRTIDTSLARQPVPDALPAAPVAAPLAAPQTAGNETAPMAAPPAAPAPAAKPTAAAPVRTVEPQRKQAAPPPTVEAPAPPTQPALVVPPKPATSDQGAVPIAQ